MSNVTDGILKGVRADVDSMFNSLLIQSVLYGIYTLIAAQALWKLFTNRNKLIYSCALLLLWITVMLGWIASWCTARAAFAVYNRSLITIFNTFQSAPFLEMAVPTLSIFISDAILIRRCYVLWRKKYILVALLTLLLATTVLRIWSIFPLAQLADTPLLQAMGTLTSFLTTVSTTALIALKIVLVTRRSHMHHSYSKVLEILIESAAMVSIVALGGGILLLASVVHPFRVYKSSGRLLLQVSALFDCLLIPAVAISPTLIAFRVSEESSPTSFKTQRRTGPLSHLTFRRGAHTDNTDGLDSPAPAAVI